MEARLENYFGFKWPFFWMFIYIILKKKRLAYL